MFDPQKLLKQVMKEALSGSLGAGKRSQPQGGYGQRPASGGLGGLLGGSGGGGLGGLLGGAGGGARGGLSTGTKAKIGLGALGVAIAAYEHYKTRNTHPASPASSMPPAPTMPPPPPPAYPPAPPAAPPAMAASSSSPEQAAEAMHLLRAMICAAHADGLIDPGERERILHGARQSGFDEQDLAELEGELAAPLTLPQLVARTRPGQREPVYVASVIAIGRDTELEQRYLDDLAQRLGLDAATREQLHAELGL